ncbi:diguanylate cyclase [Micromonosporaceae bacterium Da 78-11]
MTSAMLCDVTELLATIEGMERDRRTVDEARAEQAERQATAVGRADLAARARLIAADALSRRGDLVAAAPTLYDVHHWAGVHDDGYVLARSHFLLSILQSCLGDHAEARRHALLSVDQLPDDAPPIIRGNHLIVLALSVDLVSRAESARYHAEALDIATATGDVEMRPPDLDTIARMAMLRGHHDQAERILLPLVDPAATRQDAEGNMLAEVLLTLAEAQRLRGAPDLAQASLARAAAIGEERGLAEIRARIRREQARLHAARGDYRQAYEEQCRYDEESTALRSAEREAQTRLAQMVFESREGRRDVERFRELALRDALTGLYNRRFIDAQLPALLDRAAGSGRPLSAALVDVDFFKRVNDTLSHEVGDVVLRTVAGLLAATVQDVGTVGRFGGEEFLVLLPGMDETEAARISERVRLAVQSHPWSEVTGALPITVSIGVATSGADRPATALLGRADEHLYAAKRAGRNRVVGERH